MDKLEERLQVVEEKLDRVTHLLESSLAWQHKVGDFFEEMSPVARAMMDTAIRQLARREEQGYFDFGRDLFEALDRAMESYQPGSLPALADSLGDLLLIARHLAQPRILAALQDLSAEFGQSPAEPVEMLGAAKRIETEKDLQRGLGLALDLFGTLGRSVSRAPRLRTSRSAPPSQPRARAVVSRREPEAPAVIRDQDTGDLTFVPDSEWNREWAEQMAQKLGITLNEESWRIIEFSRRDFKESQKAPNIRRMTKSLNISTKEVYALFPSAPGPTISKIAGVPKPAGCL